MALVVTAIGRILIKRYRPPSDMRSSGEAAMVQHEGAT